MSLRNIMGNSYKGVWVLLWYWYPTSGYKLTRNMSCHHFWTACLLL